MTTKDKVARRKLSLLQLAAELENVSKACRIMGYSRQQFYEIRRNYQTYGAEGLIDRLPGARGPHPNRVASEVEAAILVHSLDHPTHRALRVAQELVLKGVQVSAGGVRGVWSRHNLLTKHEQLLRLEERVAKRSIALTDEQIRLLERFSPEICCAARRVASATSPPGIPVIWWPSTPSSSATSRAGKVYLQSAVDCYSRYARGRLYTSKLPVTVVHLFNNDVLPTFERHGAHIATVLSDNGREFCGRPDRHPYELFLQLEGIEHRTTRVKRPQSNLLVAYAAFGHGPLEVVERPHRTLLDEHFRVMGRKKFYETVDEMQADLDAYLVRYNTRRPHQGRNMQGRGPARAFRDGLPKPTPTKEDKMKKAA